MSGALKIKTLIVILIAGIISTNSTSMALANSQPTPTSLTIAAPFLPQLKGCTIEATLKDENGNPLQNMDIDFYICGTEKIGTAKTNSNGIASLAYTFPIAETYQIIAMFSGTSSYAKSSSEYVAIIIIDYIPVGIGILAATVIGVGGYMVIRRRKKIITMPVTPRTR